MAVFEVIEPDFEFWQTGIDPGLPEQAWRATGRLTGDATGGLMTLQLDVQKSTEPLSARMWSLEFLAVGLSTVVSTIDLTSSNLGEVLGLAPLVGMGYALETQGVPGGRESILPRDLTFLPWFLGAPRQKGVQAGINLALSNLNAAVVDVWMKGYVWGPRSQTAEGGPRRPLGSVFGN